MPDTNSSNLAQKQPNPISLEPLFHALDPVSLILNQNNSLSLQPVPLRLTTVDSFIMERGPRYKAYAELRETRLLMKQLQLQEQEQEEHEELEPKLATQPPRKQVKFQGGFATGRKGSSSSSVLAQSVPDFSAALRKENRRPVVNTLPSILEMTPPSKSCFNKGNVNGVCSGSRGSKSESAGDKKKKGVLMARKSYASIDELRGLSSATASAINGEGRGGVRNGRVMMGKSLSGHYRQF